MSLHSVSGTAELGQHSWLSVLYCLQRIVKINFERESLGSKRADSWGLLWRGELSSLVDYVQAGFPVAQRWPRLQAPCAEAGSTSSPLAGPGAWEPGGGGEVTFVADLIMLGCVWEHMFLSLLNPNHIRNKPLLGPLLIISGFCCCLEWGDLFAFHSFLILIHPPLLRRLLMAGEKNRMMVNIC